VQAARRVSDRRGQARPSVIVIVIVIVIVVVIIVVIIVVVVIAVIVIIIVVIVIIVIVIVIVIIVIIVVFLLRFVFLFRLAGRTREFAGFAATASGKCEWTCSTVACVHERGQHGHEHEHEHASSHWLATSYVDANVDADVDADVNGHARAIRPVAGSLTHRDRCVGRGSGWPLFFFLILRDVVVARCSSSSYLGCTRA